MGRTITVVLGGGRGSRLYPLTELRAKPAVPLGGKYRLVDVPLSNAINSGLREVFVLTQFNSASLNAHVARTYRFDMFSNGYVEVLAAEQTDQSGDWYQGTADAVRQHIGRLRRSDNVLILSGDHLYRMDYSKLLAQHEASGAHITVSTIGVTRSECSGFGVLAADAQDRIFAFREKPAEDEDLSMMRVPDSRRQDLGLGDRDFLVSMGVYVFKTEVLVELLSDPTNMDFGSNILPRAIHERPVGAFVFDDYWEDIGTIRSFYESNIALTSDAPKFRFYVPEAPIYTRARYLPPSVFRDARISRSIIADGCLLFGAEISDSVVGLRSRVDPGARIEHSILMGGDYYEVDHRRQAVIDRGDLPIGIGTGASIRRAIIDKNARVGAGAVIHGSVDRPDAEGPGWLVRDGIVIVRKNAVIPPGTVI
ncbi:MAG: glucose-1-phosphate adenylyltransferase [Myxococcota bacterium]|jgi:glucose-1-phosphate adenylyltransferase